jgi:hypothetical protein
MGSLEQKRKREHAFQKHNERYNSKKNLQYVSEYACMCAEDERTDIKTHEHTNADMENTETHTNTHMENTEKT